MNLEELQRLAERATPGSWEANEDGVATSVNGRYRVVLSSNIYDTRRAADSAYVAAMSPDTAKKLIAVALAAEKAVAVLEEAQTYTGSSSWSPSMTQECSDAEVALRAALDAIRNDTEKKE